MLNNLESVMHKVFLKYNFTALRFILTVGPRWGNQSRSGLGKLVREPELGKWMAVRWEV